MAESSSSMQALSPPQQQVVDAKKIMRTREWRFAVAYIESNFNRSEAARRTCRIGSKGGKYAQSTASQLGAKMLNKVEVQDYLTILMYSHGAGVHDALRTLAEALRKDNEWSVRLRASEMVLRHHGKYEKDSSELPPIQRHVHLLIPPRQSGS